MGRIGSELAPGYARTGRAPRAGPPPLRADTCLSRASRIEPGQANLSALRQLPRAVMQSFFYYVLYAHETQLEVSALFLTAAEHISRFHHVNLYRMIHQCKWSIWYTQGIPHLLQVTSDWELPSPNKNESTCNQVSIISPGKTDRSCFHFYTVY